MKVKEVLNERERELDDVRQTCNEGIPFGAPGGEAGCFECEAAKLAELEHQAGTHLSLCEHLPPNMHAKHNVKVRGVELQGERAGEYCAVSRRVFRRILWGVKESVQDNIVGCQGECSG